MPILLPHRGLGPNAVTSVAKPCSAVHRLTTAAGSTQWWLSLYSLQWRLTRLLSSQFCSMPYAVVNDLMSNWQKDSHREFLLLGCLPFLAAEPAVVRRVHERVEARHELQLLTVQVLVAWQLCGSNQRVYPCAWQQLICSDAELMA